MPKYAIIGSYPSYSVTRDGCIVSQYLCATEQEAKRLMYELQEQNEEYSRAYWPEEYISDDPNWPEKDPEDDL